MKAEMVNGTVIGNYRVLHKTGETAEHITYTGTSLENSQNIIFKAMRQPPALIRLALPDFQGRTTRFTQLQHPHLCKVLEIVRDDQAFYVVCEEPRGQILSTVLANKGRLELPLAIQIIDQVLELLVYLHQQKVTHCDLRPTNLYLDENNQVQLADAGLVQLLSLENQTTAPESISALEFTAPERILYSKILGTKVDARADLYSVGVLFYMLLSGQPPLTADSREQMIRTQIEAPPNALQSVPAPIEQIIFRALEKSPERRFAAAETMRTALQRAQAPDAGLAPLEPSLAYLMETLQMSDAPPAVPVPSAALDETPTLKPGAASKAAAFTPDSLLASVQASLTASAAAATNDSKPLPPLPNFRVSSPLNTSASIEPRSIEQAPEAAPQNDNADPVTLHDLFPPTGEEKATLADEKLTLNELFTTDAEQAPPLEIDITADSVTVALERDDDLAFAELRARTQPRQWSRLILFAAASVAALLFLGGGFFWWMRPSNKTKAPEGFSQLANVPVATPTVTPMPTATPAPVVAQTIPKPVSTPTATPAIMAQAKANPTATPMVVAKSTPAPVIKPIATPKPVSTPSPAIIAKAQPKAVQIAKVEKVKYTRPAKPSILVEKERRKRAILDSLSQ